MKASIIIPCHPRNRRSLQRTLDSIAQAKAGIEVETLVIPDEEGRGPSWARNRGIAEAKGDFVFFCDADDTVSSEFFSRPLAAIERTGADLCFFTYDGGPRLLEGVVIGKEAIRERFLPAFFGYSFEDVTRWNRGGELGARRELGQVWRCAFRRSFLEAYKLRFDEKLTLFEDAAFLSACVASARIVATIPDKLYQYAPEATGNLATGWRTHRNWEYKFPVLDFRKRLDDQHDGELWRYCEASCVFSALELLKAGYRVKEYVRDAHVRKALRNFPLSLRHPLVAMAVIYLRFL